jgi:hypothetical protein
MEGGLCVDELPYIQEFGLLSLCRDIWHTFFSMPQQPISGPGRPVVKVSRSHTHTHTHTHTHSRQYSSECVMILSQRPLTIPHKTQQTNIHTLSEIRTLSHGNRAAADQRLRPHGHRDRPFLILLLRKSFINYSIRTPRNWPISATTHTNKWGHEVWKGDRKIRQRKKNTLRMDAL